MPRKHLDTDNTAKAGRAPEVPMVPMMDACIAAQVDYYRARSLILTGTIPGEKRDGKWFCDPEALERWKTARPA